MSSDELLTDRFLTRVFDTEKEEMLYPSKVSTAASQVYINCNYRNTLIGVTNDSLIISHYVGITHEVIYIPFGERFIPTLCTGRKCINVKPVYSGDIIKGFFNKNTRISFDGEEDIKTKITNGIVTRTNNGSFIVVQDEEYICDCYWVLDLEIIGNIYENKELMEG